MSPSKFSVVIFGASSFVGQILCHYLLQEFGVGSGRAKFKWAIAGRSQEKLEKLRADLGAAAAKLPILIADASDAQALAAMCAQTRVVVSTVGPYALYGEPLLKACAESGTDYADLCGELQWIGQMLEKYESTARISGARIVHCCGFDSVPSDLGVHFLQQQAQTRFGEHCHSVKMRVKAISGTASGGTIASIMNLLKQATEDAHVRRELANPYSLCPPGHGFQSQQPNLLGAQYDADFNSWITPFVMAAINTRIVHRSNALSQRAYGSAFLYDEAMLAKDGLPGFLRAQGIALGLGGFVFASALPPTRWLLETFVLPKPGTGPSQEQQENGFYDLRFFGKTTSGHTLRCKVTGDRDPGYGSSAKILGQAAACLAADVPDKEGGFWTPATIFGDKLIARLVKHAGLCFEIVED